MKDLWRWHSVTALSYMATFQGCPPGRVPLYIKLFMGLDDSAFLNSSVPI